MPVKSLPAELPGCEIPLLKTDLTWGELTLSELPSNIKIAMEGICHNVR